MIRWWRARSTLLASGALTVLVALISIHTGDAIGMASSANAGSVKPAGPAWEWLVGEAVPTADVIVVRPAASALAASRIQDEPRYKVGVSVPIDTVIDFSGGKPSKGAIRLRSDGFVWSAVLVSPGASSLRLGLAELDLPDGVELYLYNDRQQVDGPYTKKGRPGYPEFFAKTLFSDRVYLQLRYDGADVAAALDHISFAITEVAYLDERFLLGRRAAVTRPQGSYLQGFAKSTNEETSLDRLFSSDPGTDPVTEAHCENLNASCVENAECNLQDPADDPIVDELRQATGHMLFQSGSGWYICTGGLIKSLDGTPGHFLTANHCMQTNAEAASLETYFNFTTPCPAGGGGTTSCDYADSSNSDTPSVFGATVVDTSAVSDFTLLKLDGVLPAGTTHLPFSTTPIATTDGAKLHRISHPSGAPQAYSEHLVDADWSACGAPGDFMYSQDVIGATEGGSSGSVVVNANGEVVGQLYGACGFNLNDDCDSINNRTYDGAFAATWQNSALVRHALAQEPLPQEIVLESQSIPSLSRNQTWETSYGNSFDNLRFVLAGPNGDGDLYVKFGSPPTLSSWDCRPYQTGTDESCEFRPAQTGTYYVMVNAYNAFSDATLTITTECNDTDGDGVCDSVDVCAGGDDTIDADADGVPDACDACPLDNPDDPDGDGQCGGDATPPAISGFVSTKQRGEHLVTFSTDEPATGSVCTDSNGPSSHCVDLALGTDHSTGYQKWRGKAVLITVTDALGNTATYGPYPL